MKTNLNLAALSSAPKRPSLRAQLSLVSNQCSQCQRCVNECRFLQRYGDPKQISDAYDPAKNDYQGLPFECSLCSLCTAVCPDGVDPAALFLEMRREAFDRGAGNYREHRGLEGYERKGTSKRFSWYALPEGCDTIFFPGCGLPGTRPQQTLKTFELLQGNIANLGIVLDCCTKPSHDLGKEEYFKAMFGEMAQYLACQGVKRVLVACLNCHKVFSEYGSGFETRTIYEFLDEVELPETGSVSGSVNVHDPCVSRFSAPVHEAVRSLVKKAGLQVVETRHSRKTTLCCGEGGAVGCLSPDLAQGWTKQRTREAGATRTIAYCTGCAHFLGDQGPTSHLLDLVLEPEATLADQVEVAKAPLTYFNRLKLKKVLKAKLKTRVNRERIFCANEKVKGGVVKSLALLVVIVAALMVVRVWAF